ncbi:MAG: ubiquinone/menaquinone biosynthesis methyltransferase [Elusimicrobiota bacterium]|nr:ubiquinone/menaquinone biosynthesis methyltransferase [Elusimicrobiota bacterium]
MPPKVICAKTEKIISGFYDGIFHFYEAANIFLTFGLIRLWRRKAAKLALKENPSSCLDLCCGAGDFTLLLDKLSSKPIKITGFDLNPSMLEKARARGNFTFILGSAAKLPFNDNSFDLATISFASRNINISRDFFIAALKEARRVLKPEGVFINLETSRPENPLIHKFFITYTKTIIAILCLISPKNKKAYHFLANSITSFYTAKDLSEILKKAGFKKPEFSYLFFGAAAIHKAIK